MYPATIVEYHSPLRDRAAPVVERLVAVGPVALSDGGRAALEPWVRAVLLDPAALAAHERLLADARGSARHGTPPTGCDWERVVERGVGALADSELVRLALDPGGLRAANDVIAERLPEAWRDDMAEAGRALLEELRQAAPGVGAAAGGRPTASAVPAEVYARVVRFAGSGAAPLDLSVGGREPVAVWLERALVDRAALHAHIRLLQQTLKASGRAFPAAALLRDRAREAVVRTGLSALPDAALAALAADPVALYDLFDEIREHLDGDGAGGYWQSVLADEGLVPSEVPVGVPGGGRAQDGIVREIAQAAWNREHARFDDAARILTRLSVAAVSAEARLMVEGERARLLRELGQFGPSAATYHEILRARALGPCGRTDCHNNLSWLAEKAGDFALARQHVEAAERLAGRDDPGHPVVRTETLHRRAGLLWREKRWDKAEALATEVIRLREQLDGPERLDVARSMLLKSHILEDRGQLDDALALREDVLMIRESALGRDHADVAVVRYRLGDLYRTLGRDREAKQAYVLARAAFRASASLVGWVGVARCHARLAQALAKLQKVKKAKELARRALPTLRDNPAIDPAARQAAEAVLRLVPPANRAV